MEEAYRTSDFDENFCHPDESFVEVLDSLCSILRRLVTNISNTAMREELDVRDRELSEMLAYIVFCKLRR